MIPKFVVDRIIGTKPYPALARWAAEPYTPQWRQFAHHWPNTVPVELFEHAATHGVDLEFSQESRKGWYAIGLGFFDFAIDYMALLPKHIIRAVRDDQVTILFYYHEGDNPRDIKRRLDLLCLTHGLPLHCYHFVSGNTAAKDLDRFHYFPDHELLYWHRNRGTDATPVSSHERSYQFTVLNRTHKWWRATVMADLWRQGLLDASQWSYNFSVDCGDRPEDNPIEIDAIQGLRDALVDFQRICPHSCDDLTTDQHNDHHLHVASHYQDSYCSIVLETHFDADGSKGAFLTEKTFKCLKHGHPFVIVGPAGSLATLRELGYRTFDRAIDPAYDLEPNNTRRWRMIMEQIKALYQCDLRRWWDRVVDDCVHNQRVFLQSKRDRVNNLLQSIALNKHR